MEILSIHNWKNLIKEHPDWMTIFQDRTNGHIQRVQKFMKLFSRELISDELRAQINLRSELHDRTKFGKNEEVPYILFTIYKKYPEKYQLSTSSEEAFDKAWIHHYQNNRHHPEHFIDTDERGNVSQIRLQTEMENLDILEMVADWAAMSDEFGTSLCKWVHGNIDKWEFADSQLGVIVHLIRQAIEILPGDNGLTMAIPPTGKDTDGSRVMILNTNRPFVRKKS